MKNYQCALCHRIVNVKLDGIAMIRTKKVCQGCYKLVKDKNKELHFKGLDIPNNFDDIELVI